MLGADKIEAICAAIVEAHARHGGRLLVVGLSGPQGCGKSTAVLRLRDCLQHTYELSTDYLSLDDYYLPWARLRNGRGPPGSHDTALLLAHLQSLRAGTAINSPCYDKLARKGVGDRMARTRLVSGTTLQILLLEGWLLGYVAGTVEPDQTLAEYWPIWTLVDLWCCLRVDPDRLRAYVTRWRSQQELVACQHVGQPPPPPEHINSFLERCWPIYDRYYRHQPEQLSKAFPNVPVLNFAVEDDCQ